MSAFSDAVLDDPEALLRAESRLRAVAGWGAEVRRAAEAAASGLVELQADDRPRAVVAVGPDGRLFRAVLESVCPVPFVAWPHAGLPGWAGPLDLAVIVSATGSDPDALASAAEALRRGCSLIVACPARSTLAEVVQGRGIVLAAGSVDPLALAVPVLSALHRLGLGPTVDPEPVAQSLDDVALACGPARDLAENPAKQVALALAETVPVVWGGSVLAARAARRVAEQLRSASGRPALAGVDTQLIALLETAPVLDVFADPFEDGEGPGLLRPTLVILDDGADSPALREARGRLLAAADSRRVRVQTIEASEGPDVARFASLQAVGRFAAAYLALGLGRLGSA